MTSSDRMLRRWRELRRLIAAGCLLVAGCINIDPAREGTPAIDAGHQGAEGGAAGAAGASGSDVLERCRACVTSPDHPDPTCADTYATCEADETCDALTICVVTEGCYPYEDLQSFYACVWQACAAPLGVTLFDDTYNIAMPVADCINGVCDAECSVPAE